VVEERKVGEGSFGIVYLSKFMCKDEVMKPWIAAVKVPKERADEGDLEDQRGEFWMQKRMANATGLSASVFDTFEVAAEGKIYALLEAASGGDLDEFINDVWPQGLADVDDGRLAQVIFAQLTYAIAQMHKVNITHLDLKPQNILINKKVCSNRTLTKTAQDWISNGCAVKVTDFGLSCALSGCRNEEGYTAGTTMYLSPRQLMGMEWKPYMDVWALGIILYELLFNRFPHDTLFGLKMEWYMAILKQSEESLTKIPEGLAEDWARTNADYWNKAQAVLNGTLRRDVNGTSARFTDEEIWNSDYVAPFQASVLATNEQEMHSPARTFPECVKQAAKAPPPALPTSSDGDLGASEIKDGYVAGMNQDDVSDDLQTAEDDQTTTAPTTTQPTHGAYGILGRVRGWLKGLGS
jgi:serine/threonine protein kinase